MAWPTKQSAGGLLDTHHIGMGGAGGFVIDIVKPARDLILGQKVGNNDVADPRIFTLGQADVKQQPLLPSRFTPTSLPKTLNIIMSMLLLVLFANAAVACCVLLLYRAALSTEPA